MVEGGEEEGCVRARGAVLLPVFFEDSFVEEAGTEGSLHISGFGWRNGGSGLLLRGFGVGAGGFPFPHCSRFAVLACCAAGMNVQP